MLLSKSCYYGIRAAIYVASIEKEEKEDYVSILKISNSLNLSFHFLTKILQTLTENGIMVSYRGPKGGVALAKPSQDIRLIDIVTAIDGPYIFQECILGLPGCGESVPCPMHSEWAEARERIRLLFDKTTLFDLAKKITESNLRLVG